MLIPSGQYRLSSSLVIDRELVVQGEGGLRNSVLVFDAGSPGIIVDMQSGDGGSPAALASGTVIRDLGVKTTTTYPPPGGRPEPAVDDDDVLAGGTSSGIVLYAQARVENCTAVGFLHDGIHVNTSAGKGRNANSWQVDNCLAELNGRHGLFVSGGDANAGSALNVRCTANCGWGFYDRSFLGNTYVGCLAESNGHIHAGASDPFPGFGGGYRTTSAAARHVLVSCYAELDQASVVRYPTLVAGGNLADAVTSDPESFRFPGIIRNVTGSELVGLRVHGQIATDVRTVRHDAQGSPHAVDKDDSVILGDGSGIPVPGNPLILVLPRLDDPDLTGRRYTVKRIDDGVNPVSVRIPDQPGVTERIDGSTLVNLDHQFAWVTVVADGTNWSIISNG